MIWARSLAGAAIAGAANGIGASLIAPEAFNLGLGLGKLAQATVLGALIGVVGYLKTSPLPPMGGP